MKKTITSKLTKKRFESIHEWRKVFFPHEGLSDALNKRESMDNEREVKELTLKILNNIKPS